MADEHPAVAALRINQANAAKYVQEVGVRSLRSTLRSAEMDLQERIAGRVRMGDTDSFTMAAMQATLAQVRLVTRQVSGGIRNIVRGAANPAARLAVASTVRYVTALDREFRGIGDVPLSLNQAQMFDSAMSGLDASLLRRFGLTAHATGNIDARGLPAWGVEEEKLMRGARILSRYSAATIRHFEQTLRTAVVARTPWEDVKDQLIEKSPFLQGAPRFWAERIVRTEMHAALNRANLGAMDAVEDQLGDTVKILCATFDDRTAADSYAVHGQIRRLNEPFDTWQGAVMAPPARPNDREIVVQHRKSWPIPGHLHSAAAGVGARWAREGHKTGHPPIPLHSTVPLDEFGKG